MAYTEYADDVAYVLCIAYVVYIMSTSRTPSRSLLLYMYIWQREALYAAAQAKPKYVEEYKLVIARRRFCNQSGHCERSERNSATRLWRCGCVFGWFGLQFGGNTKYEG